MHPFHLTGACQNPQETPTRLKAQKKVLSETLPKTELLNQQINHLQGNYGLNALSIIQNRTIQELQPLSEVVPLCQAEITHAVQSEHATNSDDVLTRRCRLSMIDTNEADRLRTITDELCEKAQDIHHNHRN